MFTVQKFRLSNIPKPCLLMPSMPQQQASLINVMPRAPPVVIYFFIHEPEATCLHYWGGVHGHSCGLSLLFEQKSFCCREANKSESIINSAYVQ